MNPNGMIYIIIWKANHCCVSSKVFSLKQNLICNFRHYHHVTLIQVKDMELCYLTSNRSFVGRVFSLSSLLVLKLFKLILRNNCVFSIVWFFKFNNVKVMKGLPTYWSYCIVKVLNDAELRNEVFTFCWFSRLWGFFRLVENSMLSSHFLVSLIMLKNFSEGPLIWPPKLMKGEVRYGNHSYSTIRSNDLYIVNLFAWTAHQDFNNGLNGWKRSSGSLNELSMEDRPHYCPVDNLKLSVVNTVNVHDVDTSYLFSDRMLLYSFKIILAVLLVDIVKTRLLWFIIKSCNENMPPKIIALNKSDELWLKLWELKLVWISGSFCESIDEVVLTYYPENILSDSHHWDIWVKISYMKCYSWP